MDEYEYKLFCTDVTINEIHVYGFCLEFSGPYLHINEKTETGENFLDEFSVATRDANGCRIGENISCSVMILMHCLIIIISLVNSILL